ncbi:MAG: hypothetical protein ACPHCI_06125 [Solirubrobacterales bacterium]
MIRIENHRSGPRLYIADYRIHHFIVGLALIGAGIALVALDWHDRYEAVAFR